MTVGFPQPRVRALLSPKIRSEIQSKIQPAHRLALAASIFAGVFALSVAGCGGSGNPMHPDSGTKKDMGGVQPGTDSGADVDRPTTATAEPNVTRSPW